MELQFEKSECRCLKNLICQVQNQEQTQEVRLPDAMPDLGRVLACWGQVILRSKEWRSGDIMASGGIMAWVMYEPEDGSGERSLETWIPFQMKWDLPQTERQGVMHVCPVLRSVDARMVSARKLMVRAGISARAEAMEPSVADVYAPPAADADIQLLTENYPVTLPVEAGEKTFTAEDDISPSGGNAEQIVYASAQPELADQKVMAGKVVFRGNVSVHMLCRTEDGRLQSSDFDMPFSQYADLESETGTDASARVDLAVTGLETEIGEDDRIHVKCSLVGQYTIYDRKMLEIVEDAYSPVRTVVPHMEEPEIPALLDERIEQFRAEMEIPAENVGQIADVSFLPDQPILSRNGDSAEMELPASAQVLYYTSDGNLASGVGHWTGTAELPSDRNNRLCVSLARSGRASASVSGGQVTVRADTAADILTASQGGMPMVSSLEIGEASEPDSARPSLIVRKSGECSLWELAKKCGSTVDAIRKANKLQDEPTDGRLLLIPVS